MQHSDLKSAGYGDEAPIAALATIPGSCALTVIRCSGAGSIELFSSVFAPSNKKTLLTEAEGNTVIHGWIVSKEESEKIDEVVISIFRAPKSYTGEDSIDISCHGGHSAWKAVMAVLKDAGYRDALAGEFTFRAFMNGKIDLTKSESVIELVNAKTDVSRRHAVSRLCGSLQKEINDIKALLVQVLATAEIYLDYSEDEISADFDAGASDEIAGKLPNKEIARDALKKLKKLSDSWLLERLYQQGVTIVIAGCPNSGKSSLFNSFLKEDRSIVTDIPGTTRDWIEAFVSVEGIPVRLIDTAGLRETNDSVEKIGVQRSRTLLQEADIVLYLIDGEMGITDDDYEFLALQNTEDKYIFIWNKSDIKPSPDGYISISAKTGQGLAQLFSTVAAVIKKQTDVFQLFDEPNAASIGIGTERQKKLVDSACSLLKEALVMSENNEPLDLIAPLIREAVNSLGEITGEVSTADILEEMFSRFCVGK
ncbi:MAG: tRNA uridine-5-carboxymethylaminomethyl(34) synthesis GTPase MnmE [Treponema sp.]|nr:tRNA uridine-5-carboxymethylaminomethyl(34) synthesis GTPase MnmE [Treponema sp.]